MLPSSVLCQVSLFAASAALAWVDVSETRLTQFALGLIQPAPIRFAGDAIVRHIHTGSFIGGAQLFLDGLDGCQQTHLVTAVPREGLQKKRNISLVGGGQCQHPLFEVLAVVARIAIREGDQRRIGLPSLAAPSASAVSACFDESVPAHRERGGIHMHVSCGDAKDLTSAASNACKELGGIMGIEPIERAPQAIDALASLP
jgi:hypothetical protein